MDGCGFPASWRYFFTVACKRGSRSDQTERPVAIMVELRLLPLCHGGFGPRLSFRTGWLSLTAEAEGHHVPLGTLAVPPCHFHSLIQRPRSTWQTSPDCSEAEGGRRGKERGKKINRTLGRRSEIAKKLYFSFSFFERQFWVFDSDLSDLKYYSTGKTERWRRERWLWEWSCESGK